MLTSTPTASASGVAGKVVRVCVFCGSRFGADVAYRELAEELGSALGAAGCPVVYGGGNVGLMGVVANAAMAAGGSVQGFIPSLLLDREVGKRDISELVVTPTMYDRKERMIAASDAFVILPGGLGTLDELLEVLTLRQLGYVTAPIVLVDHAGFWQPFVRLFDHVVDTGFADLDASKLYVTAPDIPATLRLLGIA